MFDNSSLSPCGKIVQKHDPDRFLTCLFADSDEREAMFALYAFNYEIAKVRGTVSEPILGHIRLQWWREAIDECYCKEIQRKHEVVQPLFSAIKKFNLTRSHFDTLIDAREKDFESEKLKNLNDLTYYASMTCAPLMWLSCELFNKTGEEVKIAAEGVATAWAMIGLMRATPFLIQAGTDALPRDILKGHGLMGVPDGPGLAVSLTVRDVCLNAGDKINLSKISKDIYCPPLLLKSLAKQYLSQLKKVNYDPFDGRMETPPFSRIPKLYLASILRKP